MQSMQINRADRLKMAGATFTDEEISRADSLQLKRITAKILKDAGFRPSRKLGQNFTINRDYLEKMSISLPTNFEVVLEIGTGLGTLTSFIASRERLVVSVEKDPRLFSIASRVIKSENISLVLGDGIEILKKTRIPLVVSSTPFSLSVPIFLKLVRNNHIKMAVLGVQTEVARRITAAPGESDYGRISVISSIIFKSEELGTFSSSSFFPRPKVSVTIVRLERKKCYDPEVHGMVEELGRCIFTQRNKLARKVVENCLKSLYSLSLDDAGGSLTETLREIRVREVSGWVMEELARNVLRALRRN